MKRVLVAALLFQVYFVSGQKVIDFKYSSCEDQNPLKYKLQSRISQFKFSRDSLLLEITWIDNCAFEPDFSLKNVGTDTLYFTLVNKSDDRTFCSCAFNLQFKLNKVAEKKYQLKINNVFIDRNNKRYETSGYAIERYGTEERLPKSKRREIYSENGVILVETFYDEKGRMMHERFYADGYGYFVKELIY